MERRKLLQGAGAVAAVTAAGEFSLAHSAAVPDEQRPLGIAHGLTVLNIRRNGAHELAVTTDKGILLMIIGKEARNVSEADALSYVAGYCTGTISPRVTCNWKPAGNG